MADRNLRIRLLLEGLDRVSKPLKDVSTNSSRAAQDLRATQDRLKEIGKETAPLVAFRRLKDELRDIKPELEAARARVQSLGRELAQTAEPTKKMRAEFEQAKTAAQKLEQRYERTGSAIAKLRDEAQKNGTSFRHFGKEITRLDAEATKLNGTLDLQKKRFKEVSDSAARMKGMRDAFDHTQGKATSALANGAAGVTAGVGLSLPLKIVAQDAMGFEDKMADVRKVVDGLDKAPAFQKMSDDIIALSTRLPMTAEGIAEIIAAGGRSGISGMPNLLAFAEDAAKMGVAFDMQSDAAGDMMATWRTAFGLGQTGVVQLADQVNALTNKYGGKTNAVTDMITRIGPLGKVAGVAAPLLASLAQVMDKNGVQAEVGATGIKNMMLTLTKGTAATKGQSAAFKTLGLDAVTLAERMQKDAGGAILDVLARIRSLPKATQASLMSELFGTESIGAIAPMVNNLDQLKTNMTYVGDAANYAGSMQKEFASRSATTSNAVKLAQNNITALKISLGTELLPAITDMSSSLGHGVAGLRTFSKEHPVAILWIGKLIAGLAGLMLAGAAFNFLRAGIMATMAPLRLLAKWLGMSTGQMLLKGLKLMGSGMAKLAPLIARYGMLIVRAAMFIGTGLLRAGMMLLANPMVLGIVALVTVLALAGYMIYKHWDTIKSAFFGAIGAIGAAFAGFKPGAMLSAAFNGMLNLLRGSMLGQLAGLGANMIQGLINGITGRLSGLKSAVVGAASSAARWFKDAMGIRSPSRIFMGFGGHLMGGLAKGIDQNAQGPVDRIARAARGMLRAMPPALGSIGGRLAAATAISIAAPAAAGGPSSGGSAARSAATSRASGNSYEIHVHAAPGMSEDQLIAKMRKMLDDRDRATAARARSSYADSSDG